MALKNTLLMLALGGVLAGCAASEGRTGVQAQDLRKSTYLIMETTMGDIDFPTLQRNLFQHRAACGSAPRFVMDEGETGYASLVEAAEIPESYENVVMFDLIQYPASWRSPVRVGVRAYSYYSNSDVKARVQRMLGAIRNPGVCDA